MSFLQHLNLVNFAEFGVQNHRNFASPVRLLCKDIDENPPASLRLPAPFAKRAVRRRETTSGGLALVSRLNLAVVCRKVARLRPARP